MSILERGHSTDRARNIHDDLLGCARACPGIGLRIPGSRIFRYVQMTPIIGGKLDNTQAAGKVVQIDDGEESYILITFYELVGENLGKEFVKKVKHEFYLLCNGPSVAEGIRIFKERAKTAAGFQAL